MEHSSLGNIVNWFYEHRIKLILCLRFESNVVMSWTKEESSHMNKANIFGNVQTLRIARLYKLK